MTIEELTEIATGFLRDNYDMDLGIPILRNNRLRTAMGIFYENSDGKSANSIEIAGFVIKYGAREAVIDTLKHECVHYALFERGEPYADGHPHFEAELSKRRVSSTRTNKIGMFYVATCHGCGDETLGKNSRITLPNQRFISTCCRTFVDYVGERIYNGTEAV